MYFITFPFLYHKQLLYHQHLCYQTVFCIRFVFHIIDILCLVYASLSAIADCLASNCASWAQLDANQSSDRAKEKHEIRIKGIVLLDSDWLLSANNMETVPKGPMRRIQTQLAATALPVSPLKPSYQVLTSIIVWQFKKVVL